MRHANASLLDLLLELQTLDRVPRSGYFLRGISDCESVSEHTFHLDTLNPANLATLDADQARFATRNRGGQPIVRTAFQVLTGDDSACATEE